MKEEQNSFLVVVWIHVLNFICWKPNAQGVGIRSGASESSALMTEISALLKVAPGSLISTSPRWGHRENLALWNLGEGAH